MHRGTFCDRDTDSLFMLFAEFFRKLVVWSREFGDIYILWVGPRPFVFIYRAEGVKPLLSSSAHIDKSLEYQYLKPWLGTGLVTSTGEFSPPSEAKRNTIILLSLTFSSYRKSIASAPKIRFLRRPEDDESISR